MLLLPPGDLEHLTLVGSGGFGNVYRGWSKALNMEVALKVIQGVNSSNLKRVMKNLNKERDVMQKASNPHVLRLLGVYEKVEDKLVEHGLVMEYMPNGSLRSLFDDILDVPWALRFQILHQIVLGMNYLHSLDPPIIHRDLKPCNVLLNKYLDVQITDFGLSKIVGATTSAVPSFAGTLSYMAPEALNDINYQPTKAYDVYSFGILVWTVFSGEEPYPGTPAAVIQRYVPEGQRPKETVLDQYSDVRMVSEAKELMIRCWDHNADNRPSFHDCSKCTSMMYKSYQEEAFSDVRSVQDRLNNIGSSEEQDNLNSFNSGDTDEFLRALKIKEATKDSELTEWTETATGDSNTAMAHEEINNKEDNSSPGAIDKLLPIMKESGDYKKIVKNLNNEGLITEEDQEKLNSSQNLKDFGNAAQKVFLKKLINNPSQIVPTFKSIFKS